MTDVSPAAKSSSSVPQLPPRVTVYALLAIAVMAFASTAYFVAHHAYSLYDDAYIYLRYAENLVNGNGFRWNVGDAPVEGFTGPLFLLLLSAGGLAGADLESFAQLLGVLAVGACITVATTTAFQLGNRSRGWQLGALSALLVFVTLAIDDYVQLNAVIGLETGLAAALGTLLLASVTCWDRRGFRTLLVLAVLTRPECALFSFATLVLPETRKVRWIGPLVAAAVVIAAARWIIFHDVLPNTFYAKAGGTGAHAQLGVEYIGTILKQFPAIALAPLALFDKRLRRTGGWFLLVALVWMLHFLRTGGDFFPFSRLAMPLVPGLTVLAAHGLLSGAWSLGTRLREKLNAAALATTIAATFAATALVGVQTHAHQLAPMHGFPDVRYWTGIGQFLSHYHPTASVATTTIGAIGYFSHAHVYDIVGLTQPEVAKDGELIPAELTRRNYIGHEKHNTAWVAAQRPDIIVFERDSDVQWRDLQTTRANYYAEWALLQEIKSGRLPYVLYSPEVLDGMYALMFVSPEYVARVQQPDGAPD